MQYFYINNGGFYDQFHIFSILYFKKNPYESEMIKEIVVV